MKIGFAQINPTVGDLRGNCELIIGAYERLAAAGAELVLTPDADAGAGDHRISSAGFGF